MTAAGETRPLPAPFFVLATQNPIEQEGTYPLPEAQLDRFLFDIRVGYPAEADELAILRSTTGAPPPPLSPVLTGDDAPRAAATRSRYPRGRTRAPLRQRARALHAPRRPARAGDRAAPRALGRGSARRSGADPRREGACPDPGAIRGVARRYTPGCPASAPPSHSADICGGGRRGDVGAHRGRAARHDQTALQRRARVTDAALFDAIRGVRWPAKRRVPAAAHGVHRSRRRGSAAEFTEYRPYAQGDDPRRIDWKLLARSDRACVRLSDDHALLPTMFIIDSSASMAFPVDTLAKWHHARRLTLALASIAHAAGDPVGGGSHALGRAGVLSPSSPIPSAA